MGKGDLLCPVQKLGLRSESGPGLSSPETSVLGQNEGKKENERGKKKKTKTHKLAPYKNYQKSFCLHLFNYY